MENNKEALDVLDKLDKNINKDTTVNETLGWHIVEREKLPFNGMFFPQSYVFKVKAASAGSVAHYSAMDESNPLSVQAALTEMIKNHIVIEENGKPIDPLKVIHETMRFWFVMLVHAYTGNTTNLEHKENCQKTDCRKLQTVVITPFNIEFSNPGDFVQKYTDAITGKILIKTESYGTIEYQPITLAIRAELLEFMQDRYQKKEEFDLQFLNYASLIFPRRAENQTTEDLYKNVYFPMTQNVKMFSTYTKIIKNINLVQEMQVKHACTSCKSEYRLDISNTGGLSTIFLDASTDNEFL